MQAHSILNTEHTIKIENDNQQNVSISSNNHSTNEGSLLEKDNLILRHKRIVETNNAIYNNLYKIGLVSKIKLVCLLS